MGITRTFNNAINYISGAVSRIFAPNDDAYPTTGVQPFAGEPNKKKHLD